MFLILYRSVAYIFEKSLVYRQKQADKLHVSASAAEFWMNNKVNKQSSMER